MFDSLHIQGFRAFDDLKLLGLGSVNLLVGKNNVGKTTVLEAIKMRCAGTAAVWEVERLLNSRQEVEREVLEEDRPRQKWNLQRLFYCRSNGAGQPGSRRLSIGPVGETQATLSLELGWVRVTRHDSGEITRQVLEEISGADNDHDVYEAVVISLGNTSRRIHRLFPLGRFRPASMDVDTGMVNCHYLPAGGFTGSEAADLWDKVVLTDLESDVLNALKIIEPGIERISLIEAGGGKRSRVPLVRKSVSRSPEPLRSLGDGMNRIFEMTLGLVNSKGGILLIDEVENGIHYSVHEELWSFIFEAASRLGSQIFATTHSWDCIQAFQKAASAHPDKGVLVRLFRHKNNINAVTFDEHRLEIATRESIEVR